MGKLVNFYYVADIHAQVPCGITALHLAHVHKVSSGSDVLFTAVFPREFLRTGGHRKLDSRAEIDDMILIKLKHAGTSMSETDD